MHGVIVAPCDGATCHVQPWGNYNIIPFFYILNKNIVHLFCLASFAFFYFSLLLQHHPPSFFFLCYIYIYFVASRLLFLHIMLQP